MSKRKLLLVGSLPFANEEDAMRRAMDAFGAGLDYVPDGEIGEKSAEYPRGNRSAWVTHQMSLCAADTANWELVKPAETNQFGFPVDYGKEPKVKPKHPPGELHKHLNFRYDTYFEQHYPTFKRLRAERGLEGKVKYQVGVPTGLGIGFGMMNPLTAIRYAGALNTRIAYEVNRILKMAGDDVIIQVEIPAELAMAYRLPPFLMGLSLRTVFDLVKKMDAAPLGYHLCLGDLNNKALTQAPSLDRMVEFSNRLVAGTPSKHKLLYMHYPLAEAAVPPPLEAAYYAALKDIRLPAGVEFIAGFVHEKRTEAEHQQILRELETVLKQPVGVACSCGLGRRPSDVAEKLMTMMGTVADA
jgi:hypothetical protein